MGSAGAIGLLLDGELAHPSSTHGINDARHPSVSWSTMIPPVVVARVAAGPAVRHERSYHLEVWALRFIRKSMALPHSLPTKG